MKYYHGGPNGRQRGAFLLPPSITGSRSLSDYGAAGIHRKDRVYVTTDPNAALMYAAASKYPAVYEVEPMGDVLPDPDCTQEGLSFECERARVLKVLRPSVAAVSLARIALNGREQQP